MDLQIQHVKKEFNHTMALADVTFSVSQGEFVSVIGPSGAGKTTLFRILNGMLPCTSGQILLDGIPFQSLHGRQKCLLQKSIATIYQDFCLVENSTCLENVLTASLPDLGFFSGVLGLYGKNRKEEARQFLDRVGLLDKAEEPVKNLSGGQKQRAAIARALMRHPGILLADEPIASLDPVTGRQILELLRSIHETEGVTILMNSHNLEFSREFSQRLIGLKNGKVVFDGKATELTEEITKKIYTNPENTARKNEV